MGNLKIEHINPDGLIKNPAFTNVITVQGSGKTIYIGEINANDETGQVIGAGDMKVQAEKVLQNIEIALHAAGADWEHLIKWTIYVLQGQDIRPGFEAFQRYWGKRPNPPAITVMFVAALGRPEHLLGIEAIAVVP